MVNWFGPESWGAPICASTPRCETPVGTLCGYCNKTIRVTDEGITTPLLDTNNAVSAIAFHLQCFVDSIRPRPQ